MRDATISGIKEWYVILLLIISIINIFVLMQPYESNTYYLTDNVTDYTTRVLDVVDENCESVHITKQHGDYHVFNSMIKNNKQYYCTIPLEECLDGDDDWTEYCRHYD